MDNEHELVEKDCYVRRFLLNKLELRLAAEDDDVAVIADVYTLKKMDAMTRG